MDEDEPKRPFFLIVIDEDRGVFSVEGPMVDPKFRSFVGRWAVPYVYGLTCGELAQMINGERWIEHPCKLTVVPMKGWKRSMVWRDTGLPWVPTSPHVPQGDSAMFQVATGMLGELGGISTGIGYTLPFQCIAAPNLDAHKTAEALNSYHLPGLRFKPITYKPYYFAFKDKQIAGVQVFFTEPSRAPLAALNIYALEALRKVCGRDLFAEVASSTNRSTNRIFSMFDKVNGTDATRKALQAGQSASEVVASWKPGEDAFRKTRKAYLLY